MHKLVILVEPLADDAAFDEIWPQFLHIAEKMPGLQRETTSRIDGVLYGRYQCTMMHELYFDSLEVLQEAMKSPQGRTAGELLQKMTAGRLTLLLADHKEDDLENIRKHSQQGSNVDGPSS